MTFLDTRWIYIHTSRICSCAPWICHSLVQDASYYTTSAIIDSLINVILKLFLTRSWKWLSSLCALIHSLKNLLNKSYTRTKERNSIIHLTKRLLILCIMKVCSRDWESVPACIFASSEIEVSEPCLIETSLWVLCIKTTYDPINYIRASRTLQKHPVSE